MVFEEKIAIIYVNEFIDLNNIRIYKNTLFTIKGIFQ